MNNGDEWNKCFSATYTLFPKLSSLNIIFFLFFLHCDILSASTKEGVHGHNGWLPPAPNLSRVVNKFCNIDCNKNMKLLLIGEYNMNLKHPNHVLCKKRMEIKGSEISHD